MIQDIAIIGIGCRFPQGENPQSFWRLLSQGADSITASNRPFLNIKAGFLEKIEYFDPQFFGISAQEAISMDPQQRLLLEVSWEAIEDAGLLPAELEGSSTGVFIGISGSDYYDLLLQQSLELDKYTTTGISNSIAANRISYFLNLQGPSLAIDTACSSSLVAVHLACQSICCGESNLALVGGAHILLSENIDSALKKTGMLSNQGQCRSFDQDADGYVRGEGVGIIVLKPLTQAIKDRNMIYSVIKGTAVNQDGRTNGLTAPNLQAQTTLVQKAYQNAGILPNQVDYIEAQGTGTLLGDAIELQALATVLSKKRSLDNPCRIGSVKTNIGHLEAASGIASIIKVALALRYREIPASLNYQRRNSYLKLEDIPIIVQQEHISYKSKAKMICGVSGFGFGGTNAHIVLESAPQPSPPVQGIERPWHILTLSAKTETSLHQLCSLYIDFLAQNPQLDLGDLCYSTNTCRTHFKHRLAIIARSNDDLIEKLQSFVRTKLAKGVLYGLVKPKQTQKLGFLFSGLILDFNTLNLDRELYETQPTFARVLAHCDEVVRRLFGFSPLAILYSGTEKITVDDLAKCVVLYCLQVALGELWRSWGIEPKLVMGMSLGEYSAGYFAGIWTLEDQLRELANIYYGYHKLKPSLPVGRMLAVLSTQEEVARAIKPHSKKIEIVYYDGVLTLVSGEQSAIDELIISLKSKHIRVINPESTIALHSPLMKELIDYLVANPLKGDLTLRQPSIHYVSGITGQTIEQEESTNILYWYDIILKPLNLFKGLSTMYEQGARIFLEIGPKPMLVTPGIHHLSDQGLTWLHSLRPRQSNWETLLLNLGQLYTLGFSIDWNGFEQGYVRKYVQLPSYPFNRQRYWPKQPKQSKSLEQEYLEDLSDNGKSTNEQRIDSAIIVGQSEQAIEEYLRRQIAQLINSSATYLDPQQSINSLGLDSLKALQLINRLKLELNLDLSIDKLFQDISISELAEELHICFKQQKDNTPNLVNTSDQKDSPISFSQELFWSLENFGFENYSFNLFFAFHFVGNLDISVLENSLQQIIARHEVLRTTFNIVQGKPIQTIDSNLNFVLEIVECQSPLDELITEEANKPFNLQKAPLVRVKLLRVSAHSNILLINIPHLLFDGSSAVIFFLELKTIYQQISQGQSVSLPLLESQYKNFIQWQSQNEELEKLQIYWKERLGNKFTNISIPTDYPRIYSARLLGAGESFELPSNLSQELQNFANSNGCTMFMLLLAVLDLLIYYYTGEQKFYLGTVTTNRHKKEFENMIGCFVNFLPIPVVLNDNLTFEQLLAQVRQSVLDSFSHNIPYTKIQHFLEPSHYQIPSSVVLIFHNQIPLMNQKVQISDNLFVSLEESSSIIRRDLTLHLVNTSNGVVGRLAYDSALFSASTIKTFVEKYSALLQAVVKLPNLKIYQGLTDKLWFSS
jgi:acyl transferase domain-containing protein/NRPS condensation-like uncharacterized protein